MPDDFARGGESPFDHSQPSGVPPTTSGKAIASLVLGLLSFICNFFTGIPAIILGILGLLEINKSNCKVQGNGLATAGIVTGSLGTLMVCFVLPFLVGLLLPAVQAARQAAQRNQSNNHLKQIGLSLFNYHEANGSFPAAFSQDDNGQALVSWRVAMLPYLEEAALAKRFHPDEPWDSAGNDALVDQCPNIYKSPGDQLNPGTETNILGIVGPETVLAVDGPVKLTDISDGASRTIVAVELAGTGIQWSEPRDITVDELLAAMRRRPSERGPHPVYPGGVMCVFADGSVHFISSDIDPMALRSLCTRSGGEAVQVPLD
jgi:hypothetical protein